MTLKSTKPTAMGVKTVIGTGTDNFAIEQKRDPRNI